MAHPHLIRFIQGLSTAEIRLVEDHLNRSRAIIGEKKEESMEHTLFKYLIRNNKTTVTNEMIIAETGTKRVTDLKNNLFSKILEVLTSDKHLNNKELFNEYDIAVFVLKKKLLAFKVSSRSLNQNKTETLNELLDGIIDKAKEFEIYEVLVEALDAKKYFRGIRLGLADFEKINTELKFYESCYAAVKKANDNYYKLILNSGLLKKLSIQEANAHLLSSIKDMEDDYKKTKSEQVNYYLHILKFALCERQKKYLLAIDYCNKTLKIITKNKSIYRKERLGFIHDNLSLFKTYLCDYASATKDARYAQKYYNENSLNYAISKEQEFRANFYNQNYTEARKCLIELLNHPTIDTGQFRKSKFTYYLACTLFAQKNFSGALRLLNEALEIEKDKTRWNVSLRILNIMIFLEMNKVNEASISLEALRKHMGRTEKSFEVSARDAIIVKLLREIEKDGFQFKSKNSAASKLLKSLNETGTPNSWEHYSSELIKFHEWIQQKK